MDGHIGHLHCDYRILGNSASANVLVARLERMAREQIAVNYATALDEALGDNPAVYILRQVEFDITLLVDIHVTDAQLAQRWGERMAGAVMHAIAAQSMGTVSSGGRDAGAPLQVVCFANQAEYVARFLADLAHGTAWNHWFYGAFAALRARDPWEIVRTVLHENADHLPAILGYLQRYGTLAALLAMLDASNQGWLWSQVRITPGTERAAFGSLLVEALRLVDQLDLWAASPSNREVLLQAYLATRPSPPDWRDRIGLAAALLNILRFLTTHGHLRPPWAVPSEAEGGESILQLGAQAHRDQERYQTFLERLRKVLTSLDWLDRAWLQVAFAEMLVESYPLGPRHAQDDWAVIEKQNSLSGSVELLGRPASHPHEDELHAVLPLRPAGRGPTPRQRELMESLLGVLSAGGLGLDHRQPDAPANALRLYAMFVEQFPGWAGDPMAPEMIQRLLMGWAWVMRDRSATEMLRWLHSRDSAAALRALPESERAGAAEAFQFLADLGPLALTVIETLAAGDNREAPFSSTGIDTQCAGVALLFRALLDARLAGLVERENYPAQGTLGASHLQSMLLALYMRWAGPYGVVDGQIDRGLLVLAGQENDDAHREADWSLATLRAHWSTTSLAEEARFQAAWLQTLAAQRLLDGSTLHLYHVPLETGVTALVAGDETAKLWPLGRIIDVPGVPNVVAEWLDACAAASGHRPEALIIDDTLAPVTSAWRQVVVGSEASDDVAAAHVAGRDQLLAALAALDAGQLGFPQADLTIALTAISLLRLWARWLRHFADSSVPYLLTNFIRRPGHISTYQNGLLVELEHRPLDMVIDMAGYLAELEAVSWLEQRGVRFRVRGT